MTSPDPSTSARWPGLLLAAAIATLAFVVLTLPALATLPLSPMLLAIAAGLIMAPLARRRPGWEPGLAVARGLVLKTSVVLVGLGIGLSQLGSLGLMALPLVLLAVALGLTLTLVLARAFGASPSLAALLAAGTAICGVSAIAAAAPAVAARRHEVAYAVACIALFGLMATVLYPLVLGALIDEPRLAGLVLGAVVHDTAQVSAAASLLEQSGHGSGSLDAAMVSKLLRNACLLWAIPLLAWLNRPHTSSHTRSIRPPPLPLFIVLFLLMALIRSACDLWLGPEHAVWSHLIEASRPIAQFGFAMAMAALAMAISPGELRRAGWRPALAALIATLAMLIVVSAVAWRLY